MTKATKKRKGITSNAPVSRMFFAVMPKGLPFEMMKVALLGTTRKMAIRLYEHWNDGAKWNVDSQNEIVKIEAKNFC